MVFTLKIFNQEEGLIEGEVKTRKYKIVESASSLEELKILVEDYLILEGFKEEIEFEVVYKTK